MYVRVPMDLEQADCEFRDCGIVLTEVGGAYLGEIPDAIGFRTDGTSILIECKASRNDFFREQFEKASRRVPMLGLGQQRYYMAERGLLDISELPEGWGLLEIYPKQVRVAKAAIPFRDNFIIQRERRFLISNLARAQARLTELDYIKRQRRRREGEGEHTQRTQGGDTGGPGEDRRA